MSSAFYHNTRPILSDSPTLTYDAPTYPGLHGFTGTAALQYPTSSMPAEYLSMHSKEPIFATPTSAMTPLIPAEHCIACYPRRDFPDYHYSLGPGMISARSPDIEQYLVALARKYSMEVGQAAGSATSWPTFQSADSARLSSVKEVRRLLGFQHNSDLPDMWCKYIIALAGLATYPDPSHPAHAALWGPAVRDRTAAIIHEIYGYNPPLFDGSVAYLRREISPPDVPPAHRAQIITMPRHREAAAADAATNIAPSDSDSDSDEPPRKRARFVHIARQGADPNKVFDALVMSRSKPKLEPTRRLTRQAARLAAIVPELPTYRGQSPEDSSTRSSTAVSCESEETALDTIATTRCRKRKERDGDDVRDEGSGEREDETDALPADRPRKTSWESKRATSTSAAKGPTRSQGSINAARVSITRMRKSRKA